MPRGDRTGPDGMGPMTGRALGFCAGFDSPGFTKGRPRGRGFGRGRGRGFRARRFWRPAAQPVERPTRITKDEEKKMLEQEKKAIEKELKEVKEKIKELSE